jgi:hypothetical protein
LKLRVFRVFEWKFDSKFALKFATTVIKLAQTLQDRREINLIKGRLFITHHFLLLSLSTII